MVLIIPFVSLISLKLALARPAQLPVLATGHGSDSDVGLPWQDVVSLPTVDTWSLNPSGDAAVIRVSTTEIEQDVTLYDLYLLAINAQYTVPPVYHASTNKESLYTFISDTEFVTLIPEGSSWKLTVQTLNYTTLPPAFPPSASTPRVIGEFTIYTKPTAMVYSRLSCYLTVIAPGSDGFGPLVSIRLLRDDVKGWKAQELTFPLGGTDLTIDEMSSNASHVAFVAHNSTIRPWNSTRSILYTLNVDGHSSPLQISSGQQGAVSSPSFSDDGKIAWLEQRQDGNIRDQRRLWLSDETGKWEVDLVFDLSPLSVLFSRSGKALNMLTLHDQEMSLFHLWTPQSSSRDILPTMIPSKGTIHSAIHVGITPLEHSHFVGLKSSLTSGKELWIISHSPYEDPTDNFEEIRLTNFTRPALASRNLSSGESFAFTNEVGDEIQARIFLPAVYELEKAPMIVYFHGDEEGGGWHDWWMSYWNPNVFVKAGFAVLTINPTGAEGYSNNFTQSRTYNWGSRTIDDLKRGVIHAIHHYPVDHDRLVGMGYGAYGSFVAHWIQGHNDLKFKAFVTHNGILSPRWWALTTSTPAVANWEFGPLSLEPDSPFTLWDPERFIDEWSTPELVITDGMDDGDTGPPSQSLATYRVLESPAVVFLIADSYGALLTRNGIWPSLLC